MNRSLGNLARASMPAAAAAAVVLSAGAFAPAHAVVGPVDDLAKGLTEAAVPAVVGLVAPLVPVPGAAQPGSQSAPGDGSLPGLGGEATGQGERAWRVAGPNRDPITDLLGGLTSAVQPGLPVLGSMGRPQMGSQAPAPSAQSPNGQSATAQQEAPSSTGLPEVEQGGLSGLLGGLPGATGTIPPDGLQGVGQAIPLGD